MTHFQEAIPVQAGSAETAVAMACRGPPKQCHRTKVCATLTVESVWPVRDGLAGLGAEL